MILVSSLSISVFLAAFGVLLVGLLLCDLVILLNSFGSTGFVSIMDFLGDSFALECLDELDPAFELR